WERMQNQFLSPSSKALAPELMIPILEHDECCLRIVNPLVREIHPCNRSVGIRKQISNTPVLFSDTGACGQEGFSKIAFRKWKDFATKYPLMGGFSLDLS